MVCKGDLLFILKIRTVTNGSGLLLSATDPDIFDLTWENTCAGNTNITAADKMDSRNFFMAGCVVEKVILQNISLAVFNYMISGYWVM